MRAHDDHLARRAAAEALILAALPPEDVALHLGAGERLFAAAGWHGISPEQLPALLVRCPAQTPAENAEAWARWMLLPGVARTCAAVFNLNEQWLRVGASLEDRITPPADPQGGETFLRQVQWSDPHGVDTAQPRDQGLPALEVWISMDAAGRPSTPGSGPTVLVERTRRGAHTAREAATLSFRLRLDEDERAPGEFAQVLLSLIKSQYPLQVRPVDRVQLQGALLGRVHPAQAAARTEALNPEDDFQGLLSILALDGAHSARQHGLCTLPMLPYTLLHAALKLSPAQRQQAETRAMHTYLRDLLVDCTGPKSFEDPQGVSALN